MYKRSGRANGTGTIAFYIVLFSCLVAIAVTSYVVTRGTDELSSVSGSTEEGGGRDTPVGESFELKIPIAELPLESILKANEEPSSAPATEAAPPGTAPAPAEEGEADASVFSPAEGDPDASEVPAEEAPTSFMRPLNGQISAPYSLDELFYSKTLDDWRVHAGVDIKASVGTPVKAFADGTVADIYTDELMGEIVILRHSDTLFSLYANLSPSIPVRTGQAVKLGDVIGGVGETALIELGDVPHLHFEVISDGRQVDPMQYID